MNELGHIVVVEFKLFQLEQVTDIIQAAGDEVIHTDHLVTLFDEPVAKMRTQKPGCSCYQNPFTLHIFYLMTSRPTLW